jgi:hypothetical protein
MRLLGTAARRIQRRRRAQVSGSVTSGVWLTSSPVGSVFTLRARNPHSAVSATSVMNPATQSQRWLSSARLGSTTNGYPTRASMLPRLLAAYRK